MLGCAIVFCHRGRQSSGKVDLHPDDANNSRALRLEAIGSVGCDIKQVAQARCRRGVSEKFPAEACLLMT